MKVFVLALDGLEYNVVLGGNHANLQQTCFKKLQVPIKPSLGVPSSPTVWSSFLTGHETDIEFAMPKAHKLLAFAKKCLPFVSLGLHKRFAKAAEFPELNEKTLLDFVPNSEAINFPFINYDGKVFEKIAEFYRGKTTLDKAIKDCLRICTDETGRILKHIGGVVTHENRDLVMAYLHFPDILHHLAYQREDIVKQHYFYLNNLAGTVQKLVDDKTLLFIVSDHGFDFSKGLHSLHGFISCNKEIKLPKSIIDLHDLIRCEVKYA